MISARSRKKDRFRSPFADMCPPFGRSPHHLNYRRCPAQGPVARNPLRRLCSAPNRQLRRGLAGPPLGAPEPGRCGGRPACAAPAPLRDSPDGCGFPVRRARLVGSESSSFAAPRGLCGAAVFGPPARGCAGFGPAGLAPVVVPAGFAPTGFAPAGFVVAPGRPPLRAGFSSASTPVWPS